MQILSWHDPASGTDVYRVLWDASRCEAAFVDIPESAMKTDRPTVSAARFGMGTGVGEGTPWANDSCVACHPTPAYSHWTRHHKASYGGSGRASTASRWSTSPPSAAFGIPAKKDPREVRVQGRGTMVCQRL